VSKPPFCEKACPNKSPRRFARGGRGGKVVHVTTLEDGEEEGTLRHALTVATGPRTIVFDVGGVITTTSRLTVNGRYITVAGQTAPGKGIVVQGWPLGLSGASDVIFRHVRVRPGIVSGATIDGMGMQGSNYCIMDRCSVVSRTLQKNGLLANEVRAGLSTSVSPRAQHTTSPSSGP
jgi:hypothetical protein